MSIEFKLSFCGKCQVVPFERREQTGSESHSVTKGLWGPLTKGFNKMYFPDRKF